MTTASETNSPTIAALAKALGPENRYSPRSAAAATATAAPAANPTTARTATDARLASVADDSNTTKRAGPTAPAEGADWTVQAANRIEELVDTIRSNTSDRLVKVARLLVFGLLAAFMGMMALVLVTVAAVRVLDIVLPRGVWVPDLILGGIFVALGLLLWSKRSAREPRAR